MGQKETDIHIPKSDTQHTEILTFEEAQKHREESAVYDREKWLYIPDFYSEYRYILGTAGKKPLITIGINPSTAEPDNLDNTLKSVERIALFNGFDSFIMFNVYAQRATNPDHMDKEFNRALHEENMNAFRWVLSRSGEEPGIWAASGTHGVDLRPVVMFVRTPSYTPRISMEEITDKADAQAYLDKRVRFRVYQAAGL